VDKLLKQAFAIATKGTLYQSNHVSIKFYYLFFYPVHIKEIAAIKQKKSSM
jgi:hypothetical protein